MFHILDLNNDGYLTQNEIETICIATRDREEGQNYDHLNPSFNTFEKNGKEEAKKLMKKLDPTNEGKVSKEIFLTVMLNEPEFEKFRNRFNIVRQGRDLGNGQLALGDFLKDKNASSFKKLYFLSKTNENH